MNNTEIIRRGTETSNFKITITADGSLRIKISPKATQYEELFFIARCETIRQHFIDNPFPLTLRGQSNISTSNIKLGNASKTRKHKWQFIVIGTDVQLYNHNHTIIEQSDVN